MARPTKQGVDYFPLDVHMDDKFKFIEIKYKLEGFAIVIKLMQRIYSQGYWCKWTEDEQLLFSDEIKADFNLVNDVANECLKRGIFNNDLYERYNILTSKGIQKRFKEIVRRRKDVEVTPEYLLIDGTLGVIDDINPSSSKQHDSKSTQSKVKESKVNKTKEDEKKIKHLDNVLLTESEYKRLLSDYGKDALESKIEDLDTYISNKGKNPYKDHNKTIRNWMKKDNVKTTKEIEDEQKSNEPSVKERIEEIDLMLKMGRDYYRMNKTPEKYDELLEAREKLEQQL